MMYHAESFAKLGFDTYLIGYKSENCPYRIFFRLTFYTSGSKPILSLTSLSNIRLCYLSESPPLVMRIPFVPAAPIKILYQIATILYTLVFVIPRPPEFIIVQVWISVWL
jgi:beta-1,4-mannosyltransferase